MKRIKFYSYHRTPINVCQGGSLLREIANYDKLILKTHTRRRHMIIDLIQYGIYPDSGEDMTLKFQALFRSLQQIKGEKIVLLPKGRYDLYCEHAVQKVVYISNTISRRELRIPLRTIALDLEEIDDLTLDGQGAELMLHGMMTNLRLARCRNVTIRNLAIDHMRPTVSQVKIEKKGKRCAEIRIHPDSSYRLEGNRIVFYGDNFRYLPQKEKTVWWYAVSKDESTPVLNRTPVNPFRGVRKITELQPNLLRVDYYLPNRLSEGEIYQIHEKRRLEVGIFGERCSDLTLYNVSEYANHSHAFVFQCCDTVTLDRVWAAPREGSGRLAASQTDFVHCSLCQGKITVKDSRFEGAFDDVFNAHGFHFKIVKVDANKLTVRFMHPQAYGFDPFDAGDELEVIDKATLLPAVEQKLRVVDSRMRGLYRVELTVDGDTKEISAGRYIENITKCPDVSFCGNTCSKITTRGVLVTTRGKVVIENNVFDHNQMSGVLISNDARTWYESGRVKDVTIRGNRFLYCKGQAILILPENRSFGGYVHSGITIEDNDFYYDTPRAIYAKDSEGITVRNNRFYPSAADCVQTECKRCAPVEESGNQVSVIPSDR